VNRKRKKAFHHKTLLIIILFSTLFIILPGNTSGQERIIQLKVVADQANIRLEPDISSVIIRQVPKGTILTATEKRDEWFSVQLTSKQGVVVSGYVHESLVSAIEPFPEKKTPPVVPKIRSVKPEEDRPIFSPRFTLSFSAGGNYAQGGDLNQAIKGLPDLYEDSLGIRGIGSIGSAHLGYVLGIEVFFPLSEMISWGLGAEYFKAKNTGQVEYFQENSSSVLDVQPQFGATPFHLFLSFNPVPQLYVKGGISYFFARCSYTYLAEAGVGTQRWQGKAHAGGLGLMGGLGYVKKHSESLSFFAEITGRLARIQGFTGKEEFQDASGEVFTEKGTLYLIQTQVLEDRTHPVLFIRQTRPNEAGIISAREAKIDYSGMGFKIGLRIQF
jgi:hypothetical protein